MLSFRHARARSAPPRRLVQVSLLAILALAAALRFVAPGDVPVNMHFDELSPAQEALHIAHSGRPNVFSSIGWFTIPNVSFAFAAVAIKVVGRNALLAARLSSGIMGMGGILCIFLLARRLFGDRVGLIASFLTTVSYWHIYHSRTAFPFVQSSFFTALVLYLLVRGWRDHSRLTLAFAGICAGLALECYLPTRILLLLCPVLWVMEWVRNPVPVRTALADAVTIGIGVLLVLGPLLVCVPWGVLTERSQRVLLTNPVTLHDFERLHHVVGVLPAFLGNIGLAWTMFTEWANLAVNSPSPGGLLDVGTLMALIAGSLAVMAEGEPSALFLIGWAGLTFFFGVAFTDDPRASYRLAAAMPALFILAALGVDRVLLFVVPPRRWYWLAVRPALIAGVAAWVLVQNYRMFFTHPMWVEHYESVALRLVGSHCDGRQFYFVGDWAGLNTPTSREPAALELFCPDHAPLQADQIPISDLPRLATVLIVPWPENPRATETLLSCYPTAEMVPHRNRNGRLLFTSVDVSAEQLRIGDGCEASLVGSEWACGVR
ncbi:MAG: ArnT family glycosyltransferase [Candidatus Binatia bacterium]